MKKPIIAITMGDACGIGPELIVKVLSEKDIYEFCYPFVIGKPEAMKAAVKVAQKDMDIKDISDIAEAGFLFSHLDVLCPKQLKIPEIRWGRIDPGMGKAAAMCLEFAFRMAAKKKIDGVVSAPLNKEAFHLAGFNYLDELEFLAELTNSFDPYVIGVMDTIWTVPVTLHIPFRQIASMIKKDRVLRYIQRMDETLKKAGVKDNLIAVAALNVHAGEGGLFGREEVDEIRPAIGRHYIGFLILSISKLCYMEFVPLLLFTKTAKKTLNSSRTAEVGLEEKSLLRIVMTNLLFYVASWDYERIQRDRVYPLFIDYIVDEKSEALLICVEKMTYGSFIKKEIKIWFPKSGIEGGEGIHTYSKISEIRVKGCFLKKLLKGQYDYEP